MEKSRPQREQKKPAPPALVRLYTKVGPVTGMGGSSLKWKGFLKGLYAQIFRDPAKSRADDAGSILLACPVNPLVSMRKRVAALVKRGMQFFDQCDTLEAR